MTHKGWRVIKPQLSQLDICFRDPSEEFRRDSKPEFELAMVNEPSVFELLRFDCIMGIWRLYH